MYAIIKTGGKQYKVEKDAIITVDLMDLEAGSDFETDQVLLAKTGENDVKVGTPVLEGAKVTGKVIAHTKGKKIVVFKKKRRKGYRKTMGHRQNYTQVQITNIQV